MRRTYKNQRLIREAVRRVVREQIEDARRQEMLDDAREAIEMSDGMIDFDEWYDGWREHPLDDEDYMSFEDEGEYEEAQEIWKEAGGML